MAGKRSARSLQAADSDPAANYIEKSPSRTGRARKENSMNVTVHDIVSRFARAKAIRQIASEAEIPLRYVVREILKDEANPLKPHTISQYSRAVDDVNSRPRDRRTAMSAYDTGVAVDQMAKKYMRDHGVTYRKALSALI